MKTMFRALSLSLLLGLFAGSALADDGFQELFDGKSLEGWNGKPEFWSVEDGAITGQTTKENPTKGNTFLIWEGGELGDFELRVKFRIFGGNSGIQYRSKHLGNNVVGGYQADFEAGDKWTGILYDEKGRGVLAQRGQKVEIGPDGKKNAVGKINEPSDIQDAFKKEDWNEYVITAKGNHITQELNGEPTIELIDNQESEREMSGILALQLHAGPPMKVQFKDIRLKKLGDAASDAKSNESAEAPGNSGESKKVVFVAGKPSHGRGAHEHNAGCLLMPKQLNKHMPAGLPTRMRPLPTPTRSSSTAMVAAGTWCCRMPKSSTS